MLLRIASLAALGGFLFGYDLGLIGGAMLGISKAFHITSNSTKEAIVGAAKFGAFFGTFLGGALMLRYGRRTAIAAEAVFFLVGPLLMAAAPGPWLLVVGRLVVGLGVGGSAIVIPAYLAEIAPAKQRGAVVQMYEMMLTIGMLCSVLVDAALSSAFGAEAAWRAMVGLPALPACLMAASLVLLPESPRWLVMRGDLDRALDIIHQVLQSRAEQQQQQQQLGLLQQPGPALAQGALEQAEDELLLLWSSVEKDKDAVRQRQQQLRAARRSSNMGGTATNTTTTTTAAAAAAAAGGGAGAAGAGGVGGIPHGMPPQQQHQQGQQGQLPAGSYQPPGPQQQQQGHSPFAAAAAAAGAGSGAGDGQDNSSLSVAASRRTTFTSIDGEVEEGSWRQQQQQQQHGGFRRAMGTLSEEPDPSQERLLPWSGLAGSKGGASGGIRSSSGSQSKGAAAAAAGGGGGGGGGPWATARASLASWWQLQQQWLEGGGGSSGWGKSSAYSRVHPQHDQQQQQQGVGLGALSTLVPSALPSSSALPSAAAAEPGLEATFWHTLWFMLRDTYAVVIKGPEARAFAIAAILAVFDQATASTAVINYAPEVLASQQLFGPGGALPESSAILYPAVIAVTKCIGVGIALLLVDDWGRRPLLIGGGLGCAAALFGTAAAVGAASVPGFLAALCLFIFAFSVSWAGLYWVVVSEVFSMTAKSPASSAATSLLFLTGSVVNLVYLSLVGALGLWAFVVFGGVAAASACYVLLSLPETKGRTLAEVQALLQAQQQGSRRSWLFGGGGGGSRGGAGPDGESKGWLVAGPAAGWNKMGAAGGGGGGGFGGGHKAAAANGTELAGAGSEAELVRLVVNVGGSSSREQLGYLDAGAGARVPPPAAGGAPALHHQQQQQVVGNEPHPAAAAASGFRFILGHEEEEAAGGGSSSTSALLGATAAGAADASSGEVAASSGVEAWYLKQAFQRQQATAMAAAAAAAAGSGAPGRAAQGGIGLLLPLGQDVRAQQPPR